MDNIKDFQYKELLWFSIANILVLGLSYNMLIEDINQIIQIISSSFVLLIFVIIANSILASNFKYNIVYLNIGFLKGKNFTKRPGSYVFTKFSVVI